MAHFPPRAAPPPGSPAASQGEIAEPIYIVGGDMKKDARDQNTITLGFKDEGITSQVSRQIEFAFAMSAAIFLPIAVPTFLSIADQRLQGRVPVRVLPEEGVV